MSIIEFLQNKNVFVFDTETTGLPEKTQKWGTYWDYSLNDKYESARIVSIAWASIKNFDKNKTIALVVGLEKPRTWIKKGVLYMVMNDRAANIITVAEHIRDYTNSSVEFFYWSPDALKIIAKQCHTIKKWLEYIE